MAGGLAALLDDIAALAKLAAASVDDVGAAAGRASAKAAGVVVDDTAVTPQYVQGFTAERELPIIRRIALGSLRNKLLFIVPAALLLSQFLPWALTPLLMCGGAYLCFEGAEKLLEALGVSHGEAHHEHHAVADGKELELPAAMDSVEHEKTMVAGAVRTDFILSAEIIVIALNEVASEPFLTRTAILVVVALVITALVYGVVGLIVKMDDVGLGLAQRESAAAKRVGTSLVKAMPVVLRVLSTVGIAAMLWVGGHILLVGIDDLGWHAPYDLVHHAEEWAHDALGGIGGVAAWTINTVASALLGVIVGGLLAALLHVLPKRAH
jgi:predicted DNA repair protein MutK